MNKQSEKPRTASFPMNAVPAEGFDVARSVSSAEASTVQSVHLDTLTAEAPAVRVPTQDVLCPCGQVLVHIQPADGAAVLHVYERQVLRPHTLTASDLPLDWQCPACGQRMRIG